MLAHLAAGGTNALRRLASPGGWRPYALLAELLARSNSVQGTLAGAHPSLEQHPEGAAHPVHSLLLLGVGAGLALLGLTLLLVGVGGLPPLRFRWLRRRGGLRAPRGRSPPPTPCARRVRRRRYGAIPPRSRRRRAAARQEREAAEDTAEAAALARQLSG